VPPFEVADHSGECETPEDMNKISMIGPEHCFGTHVKGERMGENAVTIFDHSYNEDMISHPLTTLLFKGSTGACLRA
jgi:hypothetical protein